MHRFHSKRHYKGRLDNDLAVLSGQIYDGCPNKKDLDKMNKRCQLIGKCLCGQVAFEITGELSNLYQCHCELCKKATGSASCTSLITDAANIKRLSGKDKINTFTKENGFRTDFCSVCGSPAPNIMNNGDYMWVPVGVLDGVVESQVVAHIFTSSKASWEQEVLHCKNFSSTSDDIVEFML